MSKMLMVCFRYIPETDKLTHKLSKMNKRLIPDNITAAEPKIICADPKLFMAVYNPNRTVEVLPDQRGLCLGKVFEDGSWDEPNSIAPDGTYAMIRSNASLVEAVTDTVASRTMWYYMDQEKWIVSTSQRAIVMILGRFELNEKVIPWMLSAGNLGPSFSWDKRIKCIPANSIARLDRNAWELKILTEELEFKQLDLPDGEHEFRLKEAIESTLNSIQINPDHWVLPLSGGYDSRALLLFLKEKYKLETITWGTKAARTQRYSDAQIAKELTDNLGVKNTYFELDNTYRDAKTILNRFIENGEGRIDHLSGYMDGFDVWKRLHDSGIEGTIRGDVPWPSSSACPYDEQDLRRLLGFSLWNDYINLPKAIELDLPEQIWNEDFTQKESETLNVLRDRLYLNIRIPTILAALNDLKTPYAELINPFLSKKIIESTVTLPDHLRDNKHLFRKIVNQHSPPVGYAKYNANQKLQDIVRAESMKEAFFEEIIENGNRVFSEEYLRFITDKLRSKRSTSWNNYLKTAKTWLSPYVSKKIKAQIRNHVTKQYMDDYILALRTVIIIKMISLLKVDETFLQ